MNILIEGWRNINHSYALVNQWQTYELIKSSNISFKDVSFSNENWNSQRNDSGLRKRLKIQLTKSLKSDDIDYDITLNFTPFNFDKINSKVLLYLLLRNIKII